MIDNYDRVNIILDLVEKLNREILDWEDKSLDAIAYLLQNICGVTKLDCTFSVYRHQLNSSILWSYIEGARAYKLLKLETSHDCVRYELGPAAESFRRQHKNEGNTFDKEIAAVVDMIQILNNPGRIEIVTTICYMDKNWPPAKASVGAFNMELVEHFPWLGKPGFTTEKMIRSAFAVLKQLKIMAEAK